MACEYCKKCKDLADIGKLRTEDIRVWVNDNKLKITVDEPELGFPTLTVIPINYCPICSQDLKKLWNK